MTEALELSCSFGFSFQSRSILCLNQDNDISEGLRFCYVAGHTIILKEEDTQNLLQGHLNSVSCVVTNTDRSLIASGEKLGTSSGSILLWDSKTLQIKFAIDVGLSSVDAISFSHDSRHLIALTNGLSGQTLQVWRISEARELEILTKFPLKDEKQNYICCSPFISHLTFVTSGNGSVLFWELNENSELSFKETSKSFREVDESANLGHLFESAFVDEHCFLTATSSEYCIVWNITKKGFFPLKLVKLINRGKITFLGTLGEKIICGSDQSLVRTFDKNFKLEKWIDDCEVGEILSLSSICGDKILVAGEIGKINVATIGRRTQNLKTVLDWQSNNLTCLCHHEKEDIFCFGTKESVLELWSVKKRKRLLKKVFEPKHGQPIVPISAIQMLTGSSDWLIVGFENGTMRFLDLKTDLSQSMRSPYGKSILKICCGQDEYVAAMNSSRTIFLYRFYHRDMNPEKAKEWLLVGRNVCHSKSITDIFFGEDNRLFSIGADNVIQEFDVEKSLMNGVQIKSSTLIADHNQLTSCLFLPKQSAEEKIPIMYRNEDLLLTASNDMKIRIWSARNNFNRGLTRSSSFTVNDLNPLKEEEEDSFQNAMPLKQTVLGPHFDGPIKRMLWKDNHVVVLTTGKILGMFAFPLDGNPNHVGCIAHSEIQDVCLIPNSDYCITCGKFDNVIHLWKISTKKLEKNSRRDRFFDLLTTNEIEQLKDLFIHVQNNSTQRNLQSKRDTENLGHISLRDASIIMNAMGHYLTQNQIDNMKLEMKGKGELIFSEFIKLFINHRNMIPITYEKIESALRVINEAAKIQGSNVFKLLSREGDKITPGVFQNLLGKNFKASKQDVTTEFFVRDLLQM